MELGSGHARSAGMLPWRFRHALDDAAANALLSNTVSIKAKSLAEQYWRDYGAQILVNIGCAS